ncbi:MAG: ankyrin repeat domain-containing protein [Leptospiraceae bacterium]|nr:ankyrin repeat domain-containing protein [Leptospiraceae bacterium]
MKNLAIICFILGLWSPVSIKAQSKEMFKLEWYEIILFVPFYIIDKCNKFVMSFSETDLHYAVKSRKIEAVQSVLSRTKKSDIDLKNFEGNTALHYAFSTNEYDIMKLLIESGADINIRTKEGQAVWEMLYLDLEKENEINLKKEEILKLLIEKKAEINSKDKEGKTLLHKAFHHSNFRIAEILINNGIELNEKEREHPPILEIPWGKYDEELVWNKKDWKRVLKLFIDKGGNINATDHRNQTALYSACLSRNLNAVKFLLANGAKPSLKIGDELGNTVLHRTIIGLGYEDSVELVKILLQYGANPKSKNLNGETPLDLAKEIYEERHFDKQEKERARIIMGYLSK